MIGLQRHVQKSDVKIYSKFACRPILKVSTLMYLVLVYALALRELFLNHGRSCSASLGTVP